MIKMAMKSHFSSCQKKKIKMNADNIASYSKFFPDFIKIFTPG